MIERVKLMRVFICYLTVSFNQIWGCRANGVKLSMLNLTGNIYQNLPRVEQLL